MALGKEFLNRENTKPQGLEVGTSFGSLLSLRFLFKNHQGGQNGKRDQGRIVEEKVREVAEGRTW